MTLVRALQRRLAGTGDRDGGFVMVLVLGSAVVLVLAVSIVVEYASLSVKSSRKEQDYLAAIAAAQSGVDDYLSRLNANSLAWTNVDCTNPAVPRPMSGPGTPCGWTAGTPVGWAPIAGAADPAGVPCTRVPTPLNCGRFHYDADTSKTLSQGLITLTSTGRSKQVSRSVQVSIRRQGFADFLYYSDIESVDPANPYVYGVNNSTAQTRCSRHFWDVPPRDTSYCSDIYFTGGDTLDGPVHTNDALLITGTPTFNGAVSTAYPRCAPNALGVPPATSLCYRNGGSASPRFNRGISYAAQVQLPPANTALRAQVEPATATGAPGCLFTGPTRIRFNANGTMNVWSPYTLAVNPGCGVIKPNNAVVTVPADNVIFVRNVPSSQSLPAAGDCAAGAIGGFPQSGDANYSIGAYDCRAGTVFVEGQLAGRVTVGADNNILIVGDLTYAGGATGSDSLGLVANNSIEIYHPVSCTRWTGSVCTAGTNMARPGGLGTFQNPTVSAAMMSLTHSFGVQLYPLGTALGRLTVFGSISQKYRGAVGTFSGTTAVTGYNKGYGYDSRLKFAPPPYYLDPVQTSYGPATFAEVRAAY